MKAINTYRFNAFSAKKHFLLLGSCFFFLTALQAQDNGGLSSEIEIVRTVENQVDPGAKINPPAAGADIKVEEQKMSYEVPNRLIKLPYEPNNLKPLNLP